MPVGREYNYQRTRRRRRFRGRGALNKKQRKQVKALAEQVIEKKAEIKHHDTVGNILTLQWASPSIFDITQISQSFSDTSRVGDSFELKSIHFRGMLGLGVSPQFEATRLSTVIRMIMFQWKEDNNTAPTQGDILQNVSSNLYSVYSQYKLDKNKKYNILYDEIFKFDRIECVTKVIDIFVNKKFSKKIQYSNASTTNGVNHIYCMFITNDDVAFNTGEHPFVDYMTRVRYLDM